MVCIRCQKRPAIIFIQRMENGQMKQEGYCLHCARELHIKPVDDLMKQFGMSEQDLDNMENRMESMMEELGDSNPLSMLMNMSGSGEDADAENMDEDLVPGSNATFPLGFTGTEKQDGDKKADRKNGKKPPKRKFLDTYCENLTRKAREGKLDDIIGRDREIYRTIQILSRRQKNNPCLIGEAGVGKTAIAEGIAERIAKGNVPIGLKDKEIYLLDLTSLVAGTQFRGQFESRIKNLIAEIKEQGNVILVIDEVHTLVSAGEAEGSMSAANILKPALSRGEIQVIGATTFNEYRKSIEKDAALERRFQPVTIEEPSLKDTVDILEGIKNYYESYHHVSIDHETVEAAVQLSERYITDRFLPDKAIDLIDEAASLCNIQDEAGNRALLLHRRIDELSEKEAALSPDDSSFFEARAELVSERMRLQEELDGLEKEKKVLRVTPQQLAQVVELWTGIPAAKIAESEFDKLSALPDELRSRVVGQEEAIDALVRALRRNRAGISAKRKPASFIFIGPTGVGKTELCKTLAEALFGTENAMIRMDMSEYMEKHTVSRLVGSPPGYVGHEEGGQLTEQVRRRPYSVLLFDEIEKAHPDVFNILLQILEDGILTDSQGRKVDFKNTVVIMTSNIGARRISERKSFGFGENSDNHSDQNRIKEDVMSELRREFRPELLNRIDDIIVFQQLSKEDIQEIARRMLRTLSKRVSEQMNVELTFSDEAITAIADAGFDPVYGARPLRRAIQTSIEDALSEQILEGKIKAGEKVECGYADGAYTFQTK